MDCTVAVYQPHYLPRLHYLARAREADVFVLYDDVEFSHRSPQHRARIDHHEQTWLTIPVHRSDRAARISDVRLDMSTPWPVEHLRTLVGKYGEAATDLRRFYRNLCATVVDIGAVRKHRDEVARGTSECLVERVLELDDELHTYRRESGLDILRQRKERLGARIAERRRVDPDADIDSLLADIAALETDLAEAEAIFDNGLERRNRAFVGLSAAIDEADLGDFDTLPMAWLWKTPGVDPAELMAEVSLTDLTVPLLLAMFDRFDIDTAVVRSSDVPVSYPGDPSTYLARLTEFLGGDRYLSGAVGYENYLDETPFTARDLEVVVQDWTPTWADGNVCALDVLYGGDRDPATVL
jgi:hypothetical protein